MITPSQFRQDIYNMLDHVIETGIPVEIIRKGKVLKVIVDSKVGKLRNLHKRSIMLTHPDQYVHGDWSKTWKYHE